MAKFELKDSREAQFYILEDARRRSDYAAATAAQRQLRRLGVVVSYDIEQRSIRKRRGTG